MTRNLHPHFATALTVVLVTACADDTFSRPDEETLRTHPVALSVYTPTTRGALVSPHSLCEQGIGVFAFHQKAKSNGLPTDFNKNSGEPNFMSNQLIRPEVIAPGEYGVWNYTPHKYWPNNPGDRLSFFAYAPYNPAMAWEDLQLKTNLDGTKITKHYILEDDVADQRDLLWADPLLNQQKPTTNAPLQFNFQHLCARLSTSAIVNVETTSIYVTVDEVKIEGAFLTSGDVVYTPADHQLLWQNLTGGITSQAYYPFRASWVADPDLGLIYKTFRVNTEERYINEEEGFMYLIPHTQDITVTATVSQRSSTTDFCKSFVIAKTIPAMALEGGKAYNLRLSIILTPVTFTGTVDANWSLTTTTYTSPDNGDSWTND